MSSAVDTEFISTVGRNVRQRRKERGFTVQQLAAMSGVSRKMLTQIELGQANPSLITLDKVARALATDFASLTRVVDEAALQAVPAAQAREVWRSDAGSRGLLHVSSRERGGPELWTWTLVPGDRYDALADAPGSEEMYYVIQGALTVETKTSGTVALSVGDSARLATDREYAYVNDGDVDCLFARIVRVQP